MSGSPAGAPIDCSLTLVDWSDADALHEWATRVVTAAFDTMAVAEWHRRLSHCPPSGRDALAALEPTARTAAAVEAIAAVGAFEAVLQRLSPRYDSEVLREPLLSPSPDESETP